MIITQDAILKLCKISYMRHEDWITVMKTLGQAVCREKKNKRG